MIRDPLLRAWGALIGLSLGATAISLWHWPREVEAGAGMLVLSLAWLKARIILTTYLRLDAAPFWRRGFAISLGVFCLLLLGLYLLPGLL